MLEGIGVRVGSDKGSLSNVPDVPGGVVAPQRTGIVGGALLTPGVFACLRVPEEIASSGEAQLHLVVQGVFYGQLHPLALHPPFLSRLEALEILCHH